MSVGFIIPPVDQMLCLPSSAWAPFECCLKLNNACVRSICLAPTISTPVDWNLLERVHTKEYLMRLQESNKCVLSIYEIDADTKDDYLTPLRYAVGAVIQATFIAFTEQRIVIAIDGGSHHASPSLSHGACVFADVPLAWLELRRTTGREINALYIDTDVHHCDGFARSRVELDMQNHFFIMDMFNIDIWPCNEEDGRATPTLEHVNISLPFHSGVSNKQYLDLLQQGLKRIETELPPIHMIFYMCSNDALKGDPLGKTNVTENAIYKRDQMIISWAHERDLPVVIMPGRGYGPSSCRVARESMARLNDEYNIF